jgi:hypothetical protein
MPNWFQEGSLNWTHPLGVSSRIYQKHCSSGIEGDIEEQNRGTDGKKHKGRMQRRASDEDHGEVGCRRQRRAPWGGPWRWFKKCLECATYLLHKGTFPVENSRGLKIEKAIAICRMSPLLLVT